MTYHQQQKSRSLMAIVIVLVCMLVIFTYPASGSDAAVVPGRLAVWSVGSPDTATDKGQVFYDTKLYASPTDLAGDIKRIGVSYDTVVVLRSVSAEGSVDAKLLSAAPIVHAIKQSRSAKVYTDIYAPSHAAVDSLSASVSEGTDTDTARGMGATEFLALTTASIAGAQTQEVPKVVQVSVTPDELAPVLKAAQAHSASSGKKILFLAVEEPSAKDAAPMDTAAAAAMEVPPAGHYSTVMKPAASALGNKQQREAHALKQRRQLQRQRRALARARAKATAEGGDGEDEQEDWDPEDTTTFGSPYYLPEGSEFTIYYADTYLYITPDIFIGIMTGLFFFFAVVLGLCCMNDIQGMSTFYDKCPPVGKEA